MRTDLGNGARQHGARARRVATARNTTHMRPPATSCPLSAEVAVTPLMAPNDQQRCFGKAAPRPGSAASASGLGALITVTSDNTNAEQTLRSLLATAPDVVSKLSIVLVTIDFRDKTGSDQAVAYRKAWAESNKEKLQTMATTLQSIGGNVPVLVELVDMHGSCMGRHLSHGAFRDYAGSGCGSRVSSCNTTRMWKNTVAFSWALARMAPCARYVVHVDNDVQTRPRGRAGGGRGATSWIWRAVSVLQAQENLLSVHPLRGPGAPCSGPSRCQCRLGRDGNSGGLHLTRTAALAASNASAGACLLTYEGPHKPGVPHFSIQAYVMDLTRFQRVWPLAPYHFADYGPYNRNASAEDAKKAVYLRKFEVKRGIYREQGKVDPESMFEENALREGLEIVYLAAHDLGVDKVLERKGRG